jgi:hypothetical protein
LGLPRTFRDFFLPDLALIFEKMISLSLELNFFVMTFASFNSCINPRQRQPTTFKEYTPQNNSKRAIEGVMRERQDVAETAHKRK